MISDPSSPGPSRAERHPEAVLQEREAPSGPIPEAGMIGRIVDRFGVVFALGIVGAMGVLIFEIVMRYGFGRPTLWAHETSIFLSAAAFIFGGLYAVSHDKHIRIVLLYDSLSPAGRRVLDVLISGVSLIATLFFAYAAWTMVARSLWTPGGDFRLEGTGSAWNPPTPSILKAFLFFILVVMAVQFLVLAINYARGRRPDV